MKKDIINNCMVAIITPFKNDEIDYGSLDKIIDKQIENNVSILACGTTAETPTLTDEEYEEIIRHIVKKVDKRVPLMAGCGTNSTKKTIQKAKLCENLGVDSLLIVTPYYNKTTQEGLYIHYKKIAENTNLPLILYNVPARTGLNMSSETIIRLSKIDNIVGIKESSGDIVKIQEIIEGADKDFCVYSGNDDIIVPLMSVGGKGVISVISNAYPEKIRKIVDTVLEGDLQKAGQMQIKMLKLCKAMFCETNPIPIKKACNYLGLCENEVRLPLIPMSEENSKNLIEIMKEFKEKF